MPPAIPVSSSGPSLPCPDVCSSLIFVQAIPSDAVLGSSPPCRPAIIPPILRCMPPFPSLFPRMASAFHPIGSPFATPSAVRSHSRGNRGNPGGNVTPSIVFDSLLVNITGHHMEREKQRKNIPHSAGLAASMPAVTADDTPSDVAAFMDSAAEMLPIMPALAVEATPKAANQPKLHFCPRVSQDEKGKHVSNKFQYILPNDPGDDDHLSLKDLAKRKLNLTLGPHTPTNPPAKKVTATSTYLEQKKLQPADKGKNVMIYDRPNIKRDLLPSLDKSTHTSIQIIESDISAARKLMNSFQMYKLMMAQILVKTLMEFMLIVGT